MNSVSPLWRRNTAPDLAKLCLLAVSIAILSSCGTVTGTPEELSSRFSASAAWKWESTDEFILRGRARLQGENQVFSGPFVLIASRSALRIRADFCGPDGSPLLSLSGDSTGFLIYYPDQDSAYFFTGGLPMNDGLLAVNAVISLLRTGFPVIPVPWEMAETFEVTSQERIQWRFTSTGADSLSVLLKNGDIFPSIQCGEVSLEVKASSWHDAFIAWPMEWLLSSPSLGVVIRLRSIDTDPLASDTPWEIIVPVPVDTVSAAFREWTYSTPVSIR